MQIQTIEECPLSIEQRCTFHLESKSNMVLALSIIKTLFLLIGKNMQFQSNIITLLVLTFDFFAKRSFSLDKGGVRTCPAVASQLCHLQKTAEVQLPTKGIVFGLVKVLQRHDLGEELVTLAVHLEQNAIRFPRGNNVAEVVLFASSNTSWSFQGNECSPKAAVASASEQQFTMMLLLIGCVHKRHSLPSI
jgi:hypothetical protein